MLSTILSVTLSVPELAPVVDAYERHLGYRVVARGAVGGETAAGWGAPRVEGRRHALLQPASGATTWLRLVEGPATPGYAAMKTHGWNANEILVQDVDAVARQLEGSPFRMIGAPRPLSTSSKVRAMQVIGPAGELNYLTRIPPEGGSIYVRTPAQSFIDRTFIVVLGGPSMAAMRQFYADVLKSPVTQASPARINVLQDAYGLPETHEFALALVNFSDGFLIELDEYPSAAVPRPVRDGELPPGISLVSFTVKDRLEDGLPWRVPPRVRAEAPYDGRRAGVLVGAAGEWIELVEASAPR